MFNDTHNIPVYHPQHGDHTITLNVRKLSPDYLLSCELPVSEEMVTAHASDCFSALQGIRKKMEGRGWSVHCLGSRKNVWPSAMSRDMGGGFIAGVLTLGESVTEYVHILDIDESPDGSTVAEQECFAKAWFDSLGKEHR